MASIELARTVLRPGTMKRYWPTLVCSIAAVSCAASRASSPPSVAVPAPAATSAVTASPGPSATAGVRAEEREHASSERAHRLLISVIGCWLGGVWSDAEGVPEATRSADSERRCHDVISWLYGSDDKTRFERLRALDRSELAAARERVLAAAHGDTVDEPRAPQLGALFDTVAAVERENLAARRAVDRVKKDIEGERNAGKLGQDELDAIAALSESRALHALMELDVGSLSHEARALAILAAADRMEMARGLPKHLKVYVLEHPLGLLFEVPAPDVPRDARTPLRGGEWLDYISSAAEYAKHPVPAEARSLTDRELLAWGGTLMGFADELRAQATEISDTTELRRIATAVAQRLENEYRNSQNAIRLAPEPAGPPRRLGRPAH